MTLPTRLTAARLIDTGKGYGVRMTWRVWAVWQSPTARRAGSVDVTP